MKIDKVEEKEFCGKIEKVVGTTEKQKEKVKDLIKASKRKTMDYSVSRVESRVPKLTPISDDYEISNHVLGLGINGKVVQCFDKKTRAKYALKVT